RISWSKTRPSPVKIGIRKAPAPQGIPGYIRIDTVHQDDHDGIKRVYHINAVDIVTQWEVVAAVERISEAYLLPVIALMLESFPCLVVVRALQNHQANLPLIKMVAQAPVRCRARIARASRWLTPRLACEYASMEAYALQ
ncbi:MAG: hypothetical protein ACKO15_16380, partial [Burkholderiales bacterium]